MKFPEGFYCAERTLDIELPWGGLTARLWLDTDSHWDENSLVGFARKIRSNEYWRTNTAQSMLEELGSLDGVNAVQVFKEVQPGIKVGVMGYTVPFENIKKGVQFDSPVPL